MISKIQDAVSAAVVINAVIATNTLPDNSDQTNVSAVSASANTAVDTTAKTGAAADTESTQLQSVNAKDQDKTKQDAAKKDENPLDEKSVSQLTKELNKLMSKINCDLEFEYHKEVNVMSVKMIDKNTKEVLKEYPPKDMIKGMIKAREWLGAFLDRNA